MAGTRVIRLNKAAREFNIGRETIVDFLGKKGYKIDLNPNTKLTPDMVVMLSEEFSDQKDVKEEARKIGLGVLKRETISLEDRKKPEPEPEDYDDDEDIIIRGVVVEVDEKFKKAVEPHHDIKPKPEPTPEPEPNIITDEIQVEIDKTEEQPESKEEKEIEIPETSVEDVHGSNAPEPDALEPDIPESDVIKSEINITPKEELPKEEPIKLQAVETEKTELEKAEETHVKPVAVAIEKKIEVAVEEKVEEKKIEKSTDTVIKDTIKPREKKKIDKPADIEKPKDVETKKVAVKTEAEPVEVVEKAGANKKEKIVVAKKETKEPVIDKDVKEPIVLGKIDLSSINERTKPARKTAAEKRKEKAERRKSTRRKSAIDEKEANKVKVPDTKPVKAQTNKKPQVEPPKPEVTVAEKKPEDNFLRTKVEKLAGPNIIGKIELPVIKKPEKKKPVASSSDDKVKPKRKKRKRIRKDPPAKASATVDNKQKKTDDKARTKARPKPGRGRRQRPEARPELTEEEVQKQIKETLARLSGAGKSKASKYRRQKRDQVHKQKEKEAIKKEEDKKNITVAEFVTANELATMMNVAVTEVISICMQLGLFVSINQRLDAETINLVADEFGFGVLFETAETVIDNEEEEEDKPVDLESRSPIATVMGHVDHGKTKLLDYIRSANVVAGEAGGITQHIGAYEVELENNKKITFLDTPGHEAFTAMRARGAKVTDIAIIVVAADDSVMPQTVEAINHAQAANVPIVFAINKIDKPTANTDRIKDQLSQMNILVEDWGGKFQSQEISAKNGLNIDELLEKVLLESELLDLKANPNRNANGTIIESSLDKGRGYVAKLLVQNGTLKVGDLVLAGSNYGRVKAMYNERNQPVKLAGPSAPVMMLGMNGAPQAGDLFKVMNDEREAKNIASKRMQLQREQGLRTHKHITLDEIGRRIAIGDFKELNIIVKGDVDGSVEALSDSLLKLGTEEVQVNVIHKSVGQVTETDVMLASASNAIIVAFQVRPSVGARKIAEKEKIDIRTYSIIYAAIEEIKSAIEGMLSPDIEEKILCNIEVRETFKITKVGTIAGCYVLDGSIKRSTRVRLLRDGVVFYTGKLGSLKRFKDDVREVQNGYECGLNIDNYNDIKVGDIIEGFEEVEVARKLD